MIETTQAYKTSDGQTYASLDQAQAAEIVIQCKVQPDVAKQIVEAAGAVLEILSQKPPARKPGRPKGSRKAKSQPTPDNPPA